MCKEKFYEGGIRQDVHRQIEEIVNRFLREGKVPGTRMTQFRNGRFAGSTEHLGAGRLRVGYNIEDYGESIIKIQPIYNPVAGARIIGVLPLNFRGNPIEVENGLIGKVSERYVVTTNRGVFAVEQVTLDRLEDGMSKVIRAQADFHQGV